MKAFSSLTAFLLLVTAAGCLSPAGTDSAEPEGTGSSPPMGGPPATTFVTWTGHSRVGVAGDLPAHWDPPESTTSVLWKEGFSVHVSDDVEALEFSINWTGVEGSRVLFMSHSPHDQGVRMREYQTADVGLEDRHQCFRIPPEDLAEVPAGHWHPMFHPMPFGVQVEATITVRALGGHLEIEDGPHGHDPSEPGELYGPFVSYSNPDEHLACDGPLAS